MPNDWIRATGSSNAWDEEKEKTCEGLYIRKQEDVGPNNSSMYFFEKDGKEFSVWGTTLLDRVFADIKIGEEVKIEFLGVEVNPKTSRSYKNYEVLHRWPDTPVIKSDEPASEKEIEEIFEKK